MNQTPLSERIRIVLAGPRNAGKSSLMNALFGREISLVSDKPGTTTDPVTRAFELPEVGPVAFVDTPGIDDEGDLGLERVRLARARAESADIRVFVTPAHKAPQTAEQTFFENWFSEFQEDKNDVRKKSTLLVLTHADKTPHPTKIAWAEQYGALRTEAPTGRGIPALIATLSSLKPTPEPGPLEGIVNEGDLVLLVTPIDLAAPAGRLIQPQVQTIRDALDRDASVLIVKERELGTTLSLLNTAPKLVITDSQAFSKVSADIPENQLLTSFSILFARKKGDLALFIKGLDATSSCPESPRILILESCSHHRQADDIGTVKIPRLFRQMVRDDASFEFRREMPERKELQNFHLVIHCGACRITGRMMTERLTQLKEAGVPVTNYGLFLAWVNGLIPRALMPFPDIMEDWKNLSKY